MQPQSERSKMIAGLLYDPLDPELIAERNKARFILRDYNSSGANELKLRRKLLRELIPKQSGSSWIEPPFQCDYGYNIELGDHVFMNFNCVILDVTTVKIGAHVLIGPAVQIYTALHPMDHLERRSGRESASPVSIGDDVWIGGGAIICPGVSIGSRTVIGAGSVVTRSIPADVFAAGNPCRVIRAIPHS